MRARAAILAAAATILLLAQAAAAAVAPGSLAGWFLVAAPDMPDPRFAGTVIYMVRHGPDGAMGFVINRVLAEDWAENILDPDAAPAERSGRKIAVHYGGPIGATEGFILHSGDYSTGNSVGVTDRVWLSADPEILREMARREGAAARPVRPRLFRLGAGAARIRARARRLGRRPRRHRPPVRPRPRQQVAPRLGQPGRGAVGAADGPLVPPPIRARLAPMNADAGSPVPEHLRAIRAKVDKIDGDLGDLRQRMSSVERHMANLQGDVANIHERLDRQGERLDRIERRLDLSEAPA